MGKKKAKVGAMEEDASMDMSPMIDMVFLLLIFFVVNATAITVKTDKNVTMPTASQSGEIKSANGYIVVNLWHEKRPPGVSADIVMGDDNASPLATDQELEEYIKKKSEEFKSNPNNPMEPKDQHLYIRGDQKAVFKYSRKVITVGGNLGISNIVFGVIPSRD